MLLTDFFTEWIYSCLLLPQNACAQHTMQSLQVV